MNILFRCGALYSGWRSDTLMRLCDEEPVLGVQFPQKRFSAFKPEELVLLLCARHRYQAELFEGVPHVVFDLADDADGDV